MDSMYQNHVQIMAWSPFAGGKIFDKEDIKAQRIMKVVQSIADKYGVSDTAVMIAWLVKYRIVSCRWNKSVKAY